MHFGFNSLVFIFELLEILIVIIDHGSFLWIFFGGPGVNEVTIRQILERSLVFDCSLIGLLYI